MEQIRLPALGRNVRVGHLYNYYSDEILQNNAKVPKNCVKIERVSNPETSCVYLGPNLDDELRLWIVGINSHLNDSIQRSSLNLNQFWFADYLASVPKVIDSNIRVSDIFFRVTQRTETLKEEYFQRKVYDYNASVVRQPTHLVEQVVYGAEFICSTRLNISKKSENDATQTIKTYIDEAIRKNFNITESPPTVLNTISCNVYSSYFPRHGLKTSVGKIFKSLCEITRLGRTSNQPSWKPISITLREIPGFPVNFTYRLQSEKIKDNIVKTRQIWQCIRDENLRLSNHPGLTKFPILKSAFFQYFGNLLDPLQNRLQEFSAFHMASSTASEAILKDQQRIYDLLVNMMKWLGRRLEEIDKLYSIFKDIRNSMFVERSLAEFQAMEKTKAKRSAKVFILKVGYEEDQLIGDMQKMIGQMLTDVRWPVFPIISAGPERLGIFQMDLNAFVQEAPSRYIRHKIQYRIALVPVISPFGDGEIQIVKFHRKNKAQLNENEQQQKPKLVVPSVVNLPPTLIPPTNQVAGPSGNPQLKHQNESTLKDVVCSTQMDLSISPSTSSESNDIEIVYSGPSTMEAKKCEKELEDSSFGQGQQGIQLSPSVIKSQQIPSVPVMDPHPPLKRHEDGNPVGANRLIAASTSSSVSNNGIAAPQEPLRKKAKCQMGPRSPITTRSQSMRIQEEGRITSISSLEKEVQKLGPSRRSVVQHETHSSQQLLELSLNVAEPELEVWLVNIEQLNNLLQNFSNDCIFEKTVMRHSLVKCGEGLVAFNCPRCRVTCKKASQVKRGRKRKLCVRQLCRCPIAEHAYQPFEWNRKTVRSEVRITSKEELKKELVKAKDKVSSLLSQMESKVRSLIESAAVGADKPCRTDYLNLMKRRVQESNLPGNMTRLVTLADLQGNM